MHTQGQYFKRTNKAAKQKRTMNKDITRLVFIALGTLGRSTEANFRHHLRPEGHQTRVVKRIVCCGKHKSGGGL